MSILSIDSDWKRPSKAVILWFMKQIIYSALEKLFSRPPVTASEIDPAQIRRVLVVRQHDQLGDFLLATPVITALKKKYPGCHLGVMARGYFAQVLENHPDVNEILVWKPSGGWTLRNAWDYARKLRSGWDLAVVLNTVSHSFTSDAAARLSGAKWIIGTDARKFPGTHRNFLYNLEVTPAPGTRHQTLRNLDIVQPLGAETSDFSPHMYPSAGKKTESRRILQNLGWDPSRPSVGMHLGAGKKENRWPCERFADLAAQLSRQGVQVVVMWGPRESDLADKFRSFDRSNAIYVEPIPLRLLGGLFQQLTAVVVNDTGILHLAAACGTPLIALFGPTPPEEWCPIGPKFLWVRGPENQTAGISVESVWAKLTDLLKTCS